MNETQEHLTAKEDEISDAENELIQAQIAEDDQYDSMKSGSVIFMKAVIHSFWNDDDEQFDHRSAE